MTPREVIERYLTLAATLDPVGYASIWAEDGRLEMPFHPDASARKVVGRLAIQERMAIAASVLSTLRWIEPAIVETEIPGRFVLEMSSEATRSDGGAYRNRYVVIAEVRDGLITLWREYFAPTAVAEAADAT